MKAYIQQKLYSEEAIQQMVSEFPLPDFTISYTPQEQEDKDWNEEWEKNFFQPIIIGERCVIHSTFHKDIPQMEYDILINPQMAFGTGHHETTSLIVNRLLETELKGLSVLDMGCGTSILAILAAKRGATPITAIDIDDWCVANSADNIQLNQVEGITVRLGDADILRTERPEFDLIIANRDKCAELKRIFQIEQLLKWYYRFFTYLVGCFQFVISNHNVRQENNRRKLQYLKQSRKGKGINVNYQIVDGGNAVNYR